MGILCRRFHFVQHMYMQHIYTFHTADYKHHCPLAFIKHNKLLYLTLTFVRHKVTEHKCDREIACVFSKGLGADDCVRNALLKQKQDLQC